MIAFKNKYIIFLSLFIALFFTGCKDKWDEHNKIQDPMLAVNLLTQIKLNPDLTKFADLLVKTGLDKVIASSKTFTIWAPTNLAITNMDQTVLSDTAKLNQFVKNHISTQSYLSSMPNPILTIRTLNGKNILFTKTTFEEATIITADRYVGNGILFTVDKAIVPKPNVWQYFNSTATSLQQKFLQSLNYQYVDSTLATVTGIDPKTGLPILKPGTGIVTKNRFSQKVVDVNNEDVKYTYVILTDAAFTAEKTKLSKYFNVADPKSTPARNAFVADSLVNWTIVKDLAFQGDYSANLPDTLTSVDSVRVHLDKSAIIETHKVSNGVVYVMSRIDYKMANKMKPIIIQGTNNVSSPSTAIPIYASMLSASGTRTSYTRRNPNTGLDFRQILVVNTGKASFWYHYLPVVNSVTYHVYWMAVRDFNTTGTVAAPIVYFQQAVTFGTPAILPALPYKQVGILNYNEVYLGDYTSSAYGNLDTFLVSDPTLTTNGTNSMVLAYIKLVPITN